MHRYLQCHNGDGKASDDKPPRGQQHFVYNLLETVACVNTAKGAHQHAAGLEPHTDACITPPAAIPIPCYKLLTCTFSPIGCTQSALKSSNLQHSLGSTMISLLISAQGARNTIGSVYWQRAINKRARQQRHAAAASTISAPARGRDDGSQHITLVLD